MTVIALAGQKGGSGKTTIAVNVAAALAATGASVLLVDADPQGSIRTWAAVADERGLGEKRPRVLGASAGPDLAQALPRAAADHDHVVIDTPGLVGDVQRAALLLADVAILPCAPSALEAWALRQSVNLVQQAASKRPGRPLRAALLINRQKARTVAGASLRGDLEATAGLPVLATELGDRQAYRDAIGVGEGVTTYAKGSKADEEVRGLVSEILKFAGAKTPKAKARKVAS